MIAVVFAAAFLATAGLLGVVLCANLDQREDNEALTADNAELRAALADRDARVVKLEDAALDKWRSHVAAALSVADPAEAAVRDLRADLDRWGTR